MDNAPTLQEVQQALDDLWQYGQYGNPPRVLRALVCCTDAGDIEAYAVVDGRGGNTQYTLPEWVVTAIDWDTQLALRAGNCSVGDRVTVGDLSHLVLAKEGMPLPLAAHGRRPQSREEWAAAIRHTDSLKTESVRVGAMLNDLQNALTGRCTSMQREMQHLQQFPELEPHRTAIREAVARQAPLEQDLQEFIALCRPDQAQAHETLQFVVRHAQRLKERLDSHLEQDEHALALLREQRASLERQHWEQLTSFNQRGQGQLNLRITHETRRIDL